MQKFIEENFVHCEYRDLARLCDEVKSGSGLSTRLDEFEKTFFPLADWVERRFPFYAHVSISTYGLRFEFREHHFLRDLETSLPELLDTLARLTPFMRPASDTRRDSDLVAGLVAREKFLSRSIVSATFSLVEAFLSGLFFTAVHTKSLGSLACDEDFLNYAAKKENAPLTNRLDRVVQFASLGTESGSDQPFKTFIEVGKRYRDAIHHTTPFQRKDVELGGRLTALYEINSNIALHCIVLSSATVLKISQWAYGAPDATDIASRCSELLEKAHRRGLPTKRKRGSPLEPQKLRCTHCAIVHDAGYRFLTAQAITGTVCTMTGDQPRTGSRELSERRLMFALGLDAVLLHGFSATARAAYWGTPPEIPDADALAWTFLAIVGALGLYALRCWRPIIYGVVEIIVAVFVIYFSIAPAKQSAITVCNGKALWGLGCYF
jgi:hypothetical protein